MTAYRTPSRISLLSALASALCCALTAGCGSDYETVNVSGRVTLDGKPLAGVHVSFQPVATSEDNANPGPGSFCKSTDSDGQYTLEIVHPKGPGAVVGTHVVRLNIVDENEGADSDAIGKIDTRIPKKYRIDGVQLEVPAGGSDSLDIEMTSS